MRRRPLMSWIREGMACRGGRPSRLGEGDAMHGSWRTWASAPARCDCGGGDRRRPRLGQRLAGRWLGGGSGFLLPVNLMEVTRRKHENALERQGAWQALSESVALRRRHRFGLPQIRDLRIRFLFIIALFFLFSPLFALYTINDVAQLYRANCCDCTECSTKTVTHLYHSRPAPLVALAQCSKKAGT